MTDWLLVLAVALFFFFWKLSAFGLIGADEPRYAQVAREMLERHDWVTPTLNGSAWLEKPPLYYWQAVVAYKIFGVSDWAARLPSGCDALLMVLAVYWFLRGFRSGVELDGALMVATTAGAVGFARAAAMDMPLAATFTIAMLAWSAWRERGGKKYLAAFYIFLALAMLAKGPVAPFLALAVIAVLALVERAAGTLSKTAWAPGLGLFGAVALPWYVLVQLRNPRFFHEFIFEHNLARFGTNLYHHSEPFWYFLPVALIGWVPWAVLVAAAVLLAAKKTARPAADPFRRFLLVWIAVVVIFFSFSQSKLPGYILPAIPAGALLVAELVHDRQPGGLFRRLRVLVFSLHGALVGALVFCALLIQSLILARHVPAGARAAPLAAASAIAVATVICLLRFGPRSLGRVTLVPLVLAVAIALRWGAGPVDDTLSARPLTRELARFDPHRLPLAVFLVPRETEFGLAFYRNQWISRYELDQVPRGEHLVVAAAGFRQSIAAKTGRRPVYLGSFRAQKLEYFYVPSS